MIRAIQKFGPQDRVKEIYTRTRNDSEPNPTLKFFVGALKD